MFEFKSGRGSGLGIQAWVVRIFEPFRVRINLDNRTTRSEHWTTTFMCNFSPNSLENFMNTTLNNRVGTLQNRVRVR